MNRANTLKTLRLLKLQNEATANALAVLEKELSDSGVSGSSARKGKKERLERITAEAVAKRTQRIKKAAQSGS